jgi:hypothetical protein
MRAELSTHVDVLSLDVKSLVDGWNRVAEKWNQGDAWQSQSTRLCANMVNVVCAMVWSGLDTSREMIRAGGGWCNEWRWKLLCTLELQADHST